MCIAHYLHVLEGQGLAIMNIMFTQLLRHSEFMTLIEIVNYYSIQLLYKACNAHILMASDIVWGPGRSQGVFF